MKKRKTIGVLALSLMLGTGMTGCKSSGTTDTLVTIDVKADYPEKEMILQRQRQSDSLRHVRIL